MSLLIRRTLDGLYLVCGGLSALMLLIILLIVVVQMVSRWAGISIPGLTAYAGYCMGGASFFALGYALNEGSHIRVSLLLGQLGIYRRWVEIWCLAVSMVLSVLLCYFSIKTTYYSYILHEISQAQDATPVWIPQMAMSLGTAVLVIAVIDLLFRECNARAC